MVAWRIRGQEDLEDFGMETLPRTVPEPTPRGLGGPEIHSGATKVNWLITKSGPRVTQERPREAQERPRAPQDRFKSAQEDPMRGQEAPKRVPRGFVESPEASPRAVQEGELDF